MTRGCDCKIIKCETVVNTIYDAMEDWLDEYSIQLDTAQPPAEDPIDTALAKEIRQLQQSEADLMLQKEGGNQKEQISQQFIPTTQHILDSYPILTIEGKNQLWKLVLKRATVYRSQDDELSIHIYPNLPGA